MTNSNSKVNPFSGKQEMTTSWSNGFSDAYGKQIEPQSDDFEYLRGYRLGQKTLSSPKTATKRLPRNERRAVAQRIADALIRNVRLWCSGLTSFHTFSSRQRTLHDLSVVYGVVGLVDTINRTIEPTA